jgi:hypothetical protein
MISDTMRRTLANLDIPRTIESLSQRLAEDPYAGSVGVEANLQHAVKEGWVVELGSHDDPASAVRAVRETEGALGFGKGQSKIWRERAEAGRYDVSGDLYQLSEAGHQALTGGALPADYDGLDETIAELDTKLGTEED